MCLFIYCNIFSFKVYVADINIVIPDFFNGCCSCDIYPTLFFYFHLFVI